MGRQDANEGSVVTETLTFGEAAADNAGLGLVLLYAPSGVEAPSAIRVGPDGLLLGRDPPPGGLALRSGSVSREHARVTIDGEHLVVTDLDSRNGTYVGGEPVTTRAMEPGDELRVGEIAFKVVDRDVDGYARFPLEGEGDGAELRGGFRMSIVRDLVARAAPHTFSVLVHGESGTGKELVSAALHRQSGRRGPLCAVNCAAIPGSLLESELFGHKRGAFTGADADRLGLVRTAHGGTLFLDEIGDMPLEAQAKILRLLESREVTPLGAQRSERVDVRIVCATHRPLERMVREERFRGDLYARIAGHRIDLPPLRDRKEDIVSLTRHFLRERAGGLRETKAGFMLALVAHDWPYNVRELASVIERATVASDGALDLAHLPPELAEPLRASSPKVARASAPTGEVAPTADRLREILQRNGGNLTAIARELGKDRTQIRRWIKRHGLDLDDFR